MCSEIHNLIVIQFEMPQQREETIIVPIYQCSSHLRHGKWKPLTPTVLHALSKDDPDPRFHFCKLFLYMDDGRESFLEFITWSGEATIKLMVL